MAWYAMRDTIKMEMGKVTTHISADKENITVVTQVNLKNMQSPWVDTTIAHAETLAPVRHASYNMQRDMVLNFGKVVTGYYHDKMKKLVTQVSDTTSSDYFDSNLYPVMLGWLPLRDGFQQDISIYDYNPAAKIGVVKASVKEVKSGVLSTDTSGNRDVWIVTVTDEIGSGPQGVSTYYFDKADRKLWLQEINTNGRKMMMKRIEE